MGSAFVNDLELSQSHMQASWNGHLVRLQRGLDEAVVAGQMSSCGCPPAALGGWHEGMRDSPQGVQGGHAAATANEYSPGLESDGLESNRAMWPGHSRLVGREITYYSLEFVGKLHLQEWQCDCCLSVVSPRPSAFACFPSTPKCASTWYNGPVLQLYRRLGPLEGLSATGERARLVGSVSDYKGFPPSNSPPLTSFAKGFFMTSGRSMSSGCLGVAARSQLTNFWIPSLPSSTSCRSLRSWPS